MKQLSKRQFIEKSFAILVIVLLKVNTNTEYKHLERTPYEPNVSYSAGI